MKRLKRFFGISKLGGLEFIIALYPILSSYNYGAFLSYLAIPLLLSIIVLIALPSKKMDYDLKPVVILMLFLFVHFFVCLFVIDNPPSYYYNSFIQILVILFSFLIILPYLNINKLCSCINLIGVVAACGLVYHSVEIFMGHSISTIEIPFLPSPGESSRVFAIVQRPVSFFTEPQTYVSYMLVPLFLALTRKNIIWAIMISITILLSGSTTGIATIGILFGAFVIASKPGKFYSLLMIIAIIGLGYFLCFSEYTTAGLDKLNGTNLGENMRVINGLLVVRFMSILDLIFGVPYSNATDFCFGTGITNNVILDSTDHVFISAFWIALIQYGVIGLFVYLNIYYDILKKDKGIFPFWLCVVVLLFTNPDFIGANFLFIILFSYTYVNQKKLIQR